MKKIVGILSAAAVLAASVFAADVSAGTQIKGNVFSFSSETSNPDANNVVTKTETFKLFSQGNDSHDYAKPNISFSIGDDKAGAKINLTTDGNTLNVAQTTQSIWFKPIDILKVTVGGYDVALNKEQIDWTESYTGLGGNGFLVSLNTNGIGIDVGLNEGNKAVTWLSYEKVTKDPDKNKDNEKKVYPTIKPFFIKGSYTADFGNIGAYVLFNHADPNNWESNYGKYNIESSNANSSIKNFDFGVGYKNTFNPVTIFANVVGHVENVDKVEGVNNEIKRATHLQWIRPELFVTGNVDAFGFSLFAAPLIYVNNDKFVPTNDNDNYLRAKDKGQSMIEAEILAKVTYRIDAVTVYGYFKDPNIFAQREKKNKKDEVSYESAFKATIKAGATGNVGLMNWDTCVQFDIDTTKTEKFEVSVPFTLGVSF